MISSPLASTSSADTQPLAPPPPQLQKLHSTCTTRLYHEQYHHHHHQQQQQQQRQQPPPPTVKIHHPQRQHQYHRHSPPPPPPHHHHHHHHHQQQQQQQQQQHQQPPSSIVTATIHRQQHQQHQLHPPPHHHQHHHQHQQANGKGPRLLTNFSNYRGEKTKPPTRTTMTTTKTNMNTNAKHDIISQQPTDNLPSNKIATVTASPKSTATTTTYSFRCYDGEKNEREEEEVEEEEEEKPREEDEENEEEEERGNFVQAQIKNRNTSNKAVVHWPRYANVTQKQERRQIPKCHNNRNSNRNQLESGQSKSKSKCAINRVKRNKWVVEPCDDNYDLTNNQDPFLIDHHHHHHHHHHRNQNNKNNIIIHSKEGPAHHQTCFQIYKGGCSVRIPNFSQSNASYDSNLDGQLEHSKYLLYGNDRTRRFQMDNRQKHKPQRKLKFETSAERNETNQVRDVISTKTQQHSHFNTNIKNDATNKIKNGSRHCPNTEADEEATLKHMEEDTNANDFCSDVKLQPSRGLERKRKQGIISELQEESNTRFLEDLKDLEDFQSQLLIRLRSYESRVVDVIVGEGREDSNSVRSARVGLQLKKKKKKKRGDKGEMVGKDLEGNTKCERESINDEHDTNNCWQGQQLHQTRYPVHKVKVKDEDANGNNDVRDDEDNDDVMMTLFVPKVNAATKLSSNSTGFGKRCNYKRSVVCLFLSLTIIHIVLVHSICFW